MKLCKKLFVKCAAGCHCEIKISGLRGRGGAGFPTGEKWEMAAKKKTPTNENTFHLQS